MEIAAFVVLVCLIGLLCWRLMGGSAEAGFTRQDDTITGPTTGYPERRAPSGDEPGDTGSAAPGD